MAALGTSLGWAKKLSPRLGTVNPAISIIPENLAHGVLDLLGCWLTTQFSYHKGQIKTQGEAFSGTSVLQGRTEQSKEEEETPVHSPQMHLVRSHLREPTCLSVTTAVSLDYVPGP